MSELIDQSKVLIEQRADSRDLLPPFDRMRAAVTDAQYAIEDILWLAEPENEELRALVARLRVRICERLRSQAIECHPDFPLPVPDIVVPGPIAKTVLHIVNECLNNIEKHSRATKVVAALVATRNELQLTITDNGRGFYPEASSCSGRGLRNLKSRSTETGGSLDIVTEVGTGTKVRLILPLVETRTGERPLQPGIPRNVEA